LRYISGAVRTRRRRSARLIAAVLAVVALFATLGIALAVSINAKPASGPRDNGNDVQQPITVTGDLSDTVTAGFTSLGAYWDLPNPGVPNSSYLMTNNDLVDQKLVIAHVYGHSDFFRNNMWFAETNRKMMDEMANHGTRVRRYMDRFGMETVESFIDVCLSVENLIDPHSQFFRRERDKPGPEAEAEVVRRIPGKPYMDAYLNPPEFLEEQARKLKEMETRERGFPTHPVKDVLKFVLEHGPLAPWQQDILATVGVPW